MKIMSVINSLDFGGAEKLILDTVPLFEQKGIKMDVLCLRVTNTAFKAELESKSIGQIIQLSRTSVYNPLNIFRIIPFLNKYDIIHVHLFPSLYFVALAKIISLSKVKLIFTEHSTGNRRLNNSCFRLIDKFIYSIYSKIICITSDVKDVLLEKLHLGDDKLNILENGVDLIKVQNSVSANRIKLGLSDHDKLIIMVAGFRVEKDQDTLIRALKDLPESYKLILVGDGIRREVLEKLVEELDLKNRVSLLGNRSDVFPLIKMSDIAVLSSHWEGFGLVAVEAMACGIPLIASDVKGLSQVVSGGGILFEKGNVEDLKNKILSLENDSYYKQISEKGLNKSKQYDISNLIDKTIKIYKDVLNK